jgi:hypothetical protein
MGFQYTENPINWLIDRIKEDQEIKAKTKLEWEQIFIEARLMHVELMQKVIENTLYVYKELKKR